MRTSPSHLLRFALLYALTIGAVCQAAEPAELAWSIRYDPKTFDPAKVDDQASELVRFLTGGVLLRYNRYTLQPEPALAESWILSPDGRTVTFHLREHLRFSDGSPLTSADVVATLRRTLDPATAAPVAEEFVTPAAVAVNATDASTVQVHLPRRIVSIAKVFDEIAIEPAGGSSQERVTAGSFTVAVYKHGEYIRLQRNPYYWRKDTQGKPLPYLATIRLDIVENGQQDELRFLRGQYQMLGTIPAEDYDLLSGRSAGAVHDLGPSLNTEQMWFNQSPSAPIPAWEKEWFASRAFRTAVSQSIQRADLARIAFNGHATPANGFISPANIVWHNGNLPPASFNPAGALRDLATQGFHQNGGVLVDRDGHPVTFSLLTNSGNRSRQKMAELIQQDLAAIGIKLNIVTLDFPALIDRLMHTQSYEAALLGLSNVEPDPSSMMNVWLSSSPNHQWNPSEKTPATPWEAEIDRQIELQATAKLDADRKHAVDRIQEIVAEQQPFIYLVYPDVLTAASTALANVQFSVLQPTAAANIDYIAWKAGSR